MIKENQHIRIYQNRKRLSVAALSHFVESANQSINKKGRFTVSLAGGSTPNLLYSLLGDEATSRLDWRKIHFFWGDERCVPPNHKDSNYLIAFRLFLSKLPIPSKNIHRIRGELPCKQAAQMYDDLIRSFFHIPKEIQNPHNLTTFDLVILGLGTDGHTASLFPNKNYSNDHQRLAVCVEHKEPPEPLVNRVSLTFTSFNAASQVVFLVSGKDKASIIHQIMATRLSQTHTLPATYINPRTGNLLWFIDKEASNRL